MRVAVELLHIVAGLIVTVAVATTCAWSYPLGHDAIWLSATLAAVVVLLTGVGPLREARAADRARGRRTGHG